MTKTQEVLQAIAAELVRQGPSINVAADLRSLVIDIKFVKETGHPRTVVIRTETESK